MGLDSVELVMEVEKYFKIQIPDREAEKIATVQNMVDCVARRLSITDNSTELKDTVIGKIQKALLSLGVTGKPLSPISPVFLTLNSRDKVVWKLFCNEVGMNIPKPETKERNPSAFFDKLKNKITWDPLYEWDKVTVGQFADVICAANCSTLINNTAIKNTYEIYVAVIRITVDKVGVDEYEVTPEKSFTSDLGID